MDLPLETIHKSVQGGRRRVAATRSTGARLFANQKGLSRGTRTTALGSTSRSRRA
jgi:hypothetical protein